MLKLSARYVRLTVLVALVLTLWGVSSSLRIGPRDEIVGTPPRPEEACQRWMDDAASMKPLFIDKESALPDPLTVPTTRIFNQCVFQQNTPCDPVVEAKVHPWLSGKPPRITTSTRKDEPMFPIAEGQCYTTALRSSLSGRGIVLTAKDSHFRGLVDLVVMLRTLDSQLSLQIIHREGEMIQFSQERLFLLAESDWSQHPELMDLVDNKEFKPSFRKLDISLINVTPAISPEYDEGFFRFTNKLLAYMFNGFEEMILVDTDTVLLAQPDKFLEFEEYVEKGTFFFKDRSLANRHKTEDSLDVFTSLLPTQEDEKYGIKQVTSYTLNQRFFKGFLHLQESGVVVINRARHFETSLMATTLGLHRNSILERVWGDKELYWLSFAISGNENYHFNPNHAASVGELPPDADHTHYPDLNVRELCSSHPSHIAKDNHTLLWLNSGFKFCKKTNFNYPDNPFFKDWSFEEMKKYSMDTLKIRAAIIPPEPYSPGLTPVETSPTRGWIPKDYCEMYAICAYADVTGIQEKGIVVEFSEQEQRWFDYMATIWSGSMDVLTLLVSA